jgi:hypothetical protein
MAAALVVHNPRPAQPVLLPFAANPQGDVSIVQHTTLQAEVATLSAFLDWYLAQHPEVPAGEVLVGYRNVPVLGEGGRRSHVIREVREDEAATIRRIFSMTARGVGLRTIARTLNAEGVRSPRARPGRHHSWAPSSVRTVLFNPLYKGDVTWGRTEKRDAWGRRNESDRPENEWVVTRVEHLRIVTDELWTDAREALGSRQKTYGFKRGLQRAVVLLTRSICSLGWWSVVCAGAPSSRP